MKIADVSSRLYRIPPTVAWEDATHRVPYLEFVVTRIAVDGGPGGYGFSYTTGIGASAILALLNDYCAALLIGEDPRDTERLWAFLKGQLHRCGTGGINTLALAAIDIALWDIAAKARDLPLHRLLGARRDSVPTYGSGIDLYLDEDALLQQVEGFLAEGHQAVKIKIGRDSADEDVSRVRAVRRLIGRDRRLFVDANQRWTVPDCLNRLQLLVAEGVDWIEEPLDAEDIAGHADLRRSLRCPIAVGESLYTRHQFRDYLVAGAVDYVQADVCRVGGISEWLKIAHLASAFHRGMAPHYLAEISLPLLCAVDNAVLLECVRGGSFSEMGVLVEPMRMTAQGAVPSERPGHGVEFDEARLAPYEVDPASLRGRRHESAK